MLVKSALILNRCSLDDIILLFYNIQKKEDGCYEKKCNV